MSLTFFLFEGIFPTPFFLPGMKLGLANVVTVFALYKLENEVDALIILLLRNFLSVIFSGSPTIIFFSLSGGLLSFAAMIFLKRSEKFSVVGVSAAGGFFHNLGQIFCAAVLMESVSVFFYFGALGIFGVVSGIFIGKLANSINLPK